MSNRDNYNFVLLLGKRVSLYEYMYYWKKFNETLLPEKEDFYNHLNMKDISDDITHTQKGFVKILK